MTTAEQIAQSAQIDSIMRSLTGSASVETIDGASESIPMTGLTAKGTETGADGSQKVTVYSTIDGRPSEVFLPQLKGALTMKIPGTNRPAHWHPAQGGEQPKQAPAGTIMCRLHPDSPEREWVDSVGLAGIYCNPLEPARSRANLPNMLDRRRHESIYHKSAFLVMDEAEKRQREEKSNATQERMADALAAALDSNKPRGRRKAADDDSEE